MSQRLSVFPQIARGWLVAVLSLTAAAALPGMPAPTNAAAPPNVVVFYTDDHGYADLGIQGVVTDIRTPHTDTLARSGVRMLHGYSTAPQCVPSRAGLLTGRFQSRFGLEDNNSSLAGFNTQTTLAQRLSAAGYATAQFGKWHLGPNEEIPRHGFRHVFAQNANRPFIANVTADGTDRPLGLLANSHYHVDGCSQAAASIIRRYRDQPFFLYVAYRAPHVPLDAPSQYLDRFPGEMPERRRQALAMIAAVDEGVGLITRTLAEVGLTDKTLIFYIADNGAPLKIHKLDEPGGGPGWDGSLNDPLNGEKGMLAEGGIHVPFVVSWPGTIPAVDAYPHPVSTLDVAATATACAGVQAAPEELDGVNLLPFLQGKVADPPHASLTWRWGAQAAIREGDWKLLRGGNREYLYNLALDLGETDNLAAAHPAVATRLREQLRRWSEGLAPPGLAVAAMSPVWDRYFDHYLDGQRISPTDGPLPSESGPSESGPSARTRGWLGRGGSLRVVEGVLYFDTNPQAVNRQAGFLARAGIELPAGSRVRLVLQCPAGGPGQIAFRLAGDKDFQSDRRVAFQVAPQADWQTVELELPARGDVIHLRVHLPGQQARVRSIVAITPDRSTIPLW